MKWIFFKCCAVAQCIFCSVLFVDVQLNFCCFLTLDNFLSSDQVMQSKLIGYDLR